MGQDGRAGGAAVCNVVLSARGVFEAQYSSITEPSSNPPRHEEHEPRKSETDGRGHQKVVVDPASLEEGEDTVHQESAGKHHGEGECHASEPALKIRHPAPAVRGRDPGFTVSGRREPKEVTRHRAKGQEPSRTMRHVSK